MVWQDRYLPSRDSLGLESGDKLQVVVRNEEIRLRLAASSAKLKRKGKLWVDIGPSGELDIRERDRANAPRAIGDGRATPLKIFFDTSVLVSPRTLRAARFTPYSLHAAR
jgi:hypothetical protein